MGGTPIAGRARRPPSLVMRALVCTAGVSLGRRRSLARDDRKARRLGSLRCVPMTLDQLVAWADERIERLPIDKKGKSERVKHVRRMYRLLDGAGIDASAPYL